MRELDPHSLESACMTFAGATGIPRCKDEDEAVAAAITAYLEASPSGWKTMESAPKELWSKALGWCVFPAGAEVRFIELTKYGWVANGLTQQVTHWHELPAPPSPNQTKPQT